MHLSGYGLKGIYSLEEYYARNLEEYYEAISVGESHNYYLGRAEAEITRWVKYFCLGMAESFSSVRKQAEKLNLRLDQSMILRELDLRPKRILEKFRESRFLSTQEIATHLGVSPRVALNVSKTWVERGFVLQEGERRGRRYELAERWVELL
jgi:Fic family protein